MFSKFEKEALEFINKTKIKEIISLKVSKDLGLEYEDVFKKIDENVDVNVETQLKLLTSLKNFPNEKTSNKSVDEFLKENKVIKG